MKYRILTCSNKVAAEAARQLEKQVQALIDEYGYIPLGQPFTVTEVASTVNDVAYSQAMILPDMHMVQIPYDEAPNRRLQ